MLLMLCLFGGTSNFPLYIEREREAIVFLWRCSVLAMLFWCCKDHGVQRSILVKVSAWSSTVVKWLPPDPGLLANQYSMGKQKASYSTLNIQDGGQRRKAVIFTVIIKIPPN